MVRIFCDETWSGNEIIPACRYRVFYGVLVDEKQERQLLREIYDFKVARGLVDAGTPVEMKWKKVEKEWQKTLKDGSPNRYEQFLDIFLKALQEKRLSFGCMHLLSSEYERVGPVFACEQSDNAANFFFMLYFNFIYHCFAKNQVKQSPCEVFIDSRDMGGANHRYDIGRLKEILNRKAYADLSPRGQPPLSPDLRRKLVDSICLVDLADSKQSPLVQMADVCAGCVRFVLENRLSVPPPMHQSYLPLPDAGLWGAKPTNGREALATRFYSQLRCIGRYHDVDLLAKSRHYHFNIFPFQFRS